MRGLDDKVSAIRRALGTQSHDSLEAWRAGGIWLVRGTRRNRELVREFQDLFESKFAGSSIAWLAALEDPAAAMPTSAGLLWTDVKGTRLIAGRRSGLTEDRRP